MGCQNDIEKKSFSATQVEASIQINDKRIPELGSNFKDFIDIGEGNYSKVKRALNTDTNTLVALKCMPLGKARQDPTMVKREVEVLMSIHHPNVAQMHGYYKDATTFYIVMDLCPGGNLKEIMNREQTLSEERMKAIAKDVLEALKYLHKNNIMHRDIKPENIMFDQSGTTKLVDFGLSRFMDDKVKRDLTIVGTPYFLAPEMIRGKYSYASDMWSLGVVFYYALLGRLPFQAQEFNTLFNEIRNKRITYWGSLSEDCCDFLQGLLEINPSKRLIPAAALNHLWLSP